MRRLIIFSFVLVVVLEFNSLHIHTIDHSVVIFFKEVISFVVAVEEYPNTEECSFHLLLILRDAILAVYARVAVWRRGVPGNPGNPARQEDLHLGRVDPSELMRPIVWASIISLLHPEPGRAEVMHHKV